MFNHLECDHIGKYKECTAQKNKDKCLNAFKKQLSLTSIYKCQTICKTTQKQEITADIKYYVVKDTAATATAEHLVILHSCFIIIFYNTTMLFSEISRGIIEKAFIATVLRKLCSKTTLEKWRQNKKFENSKYIQSFLQCSANCEVWSEESTEVCPLTTLRKTWANASHTLQSNLESSHPTSTDYWHLATTILFLLTENGSLKTHLHQFILLHHDCIIH